MTKRCCVVRFHYNSMLCVIWICIQLCRIGFRMGEKKLFTVAFWWEYLSVLFTIRFVFIFEVERIHKGLVQQLEQHPVVMGTRGIVDVLVTLL